MGNSPRMRRSSTAYATPRAKTGLVHLLTEKRQRVKEHRTKGYSAMSWTRRNPRKFVQPSAWFQLRSNGRKRTGGPWPKEPPRITRTPQFPGSNHAEPSVGASL
jgi:hypothetical protein